MYSQKQADHVAEATQPRTYIVYVEFKKLTQVYYKILPGILMMVLALNDQPSKCRKHDSNLNGAIFFPKIWRGLLSEMQSVLSFQGLKTWTRESDLRAGSDSEKPYLKMLTVTMTQGHVNQKLLRDRPDGDIPQQTLRAACHPSISPELLSQLHRWITVAQVERSVQAYGAPVVFIAPYDNCGMPNPTWSLTVFTHSRNNGFPRLAPASHILSSCQTPRSHLGF